MNARLSVSMACAAGLLLLAGGLGCAEKNVKVSGKVMKGGRPLIVNRDFYVTLAFIPDNPAANRPTQPAKFQRATGDYEIELKPGKYRINYVIVEKDQEPWPVPAEQKAKSYDLTKTQVLDIEIK